MPVIKIKQHAAAVCGVQVADKQRRREARGEAVVHLTDDRECSAKSCPP